MTSSCNNKLNCYIISAKFKNLRMCRISWLPVMANKSQQNSESCFGFIPKWSWTASE